MQFLGVLRITSETTVENERGEARLRVRTGEEALLLKDDNDTGVLASWHAVLNAHVQELAGAPAPSLDALLD